MGNTPRLISHQVRPAANRVRRLAAASLGLQRLSIEPGEEESLSRPRHFLHGIRTHAKSLQAYCVE